jgi:hypothetical protein
MPSVKFEKQLFFPERLHRSHILNALGRNLNNARTNLDINVLKINIQNTHTLPAWSMSSASRFWFLLKIIVCSYEATIRMGTATSSSRASFQPFTNAIVSADISVTIELNIIPALSPDALKYFIECF